MSSAQVDKKVPKGIKKYIRLGGLIGFFGVILLIMLVVYFFAESIIKSGIEEGAGATFGAEVNVASVELSYSPLILKVNGFQATDADQPDVNLFSFETASAGVDLWQYLLGKTIIEELSVTELAFETKRNSVGEVYLESEAELDAEDEQSMLPSVDLSLPDVSTLLENSNLLTVKASDQLQQSYKEEKERLTTLKDNLPNEAKLQAYEQRVKALGKMKVKTLEDFNKVKAKFDQLKSEFKADQALVKSAKNQLVKSKNRLSEDVKKLKNAPEQDWKTIENKYQLDSVSNDDFAHILFGEKARGYYQTAESLYLKVAPFLADDESDLNEKQENTRATGRFIYFEEENALPSFLIKQVNISVVSGNLASQGRRFEILINELTHEHWYREKPTTIKVKSDANAIGSLEANSQFTRKRTGEFDGSGQWLAKGIELDTMVLSEAKGLKLSLTQGNFSGKGQFNLSNSKVIKSSNDFAVQEARYDGEAKSKFSKILVDTIKSLDKLTLHVDITGDVNSPKFSMSSSLDKAIKNAFKQQITNKLASFKAGVNQGLNEKLSNSLKLNQSDDKALIDLETLLTDTDNALENLKNSDVVKQQKKKLKGKAKDKIKDKLKNLFG